MENKRPTLSEPKEYAIIKQIYFKDNRPMNEELDLLEKNDRMESRFRNKQKSSR